MFENMSTVTQGAVGLVVAIEWFVENNYIVSIPLNDNQPYDLIVDDGKGLKKVQVKTTSFKVPNRNNYTVQLKTVRPNRTTNKIKKFDKTTCDLVYIVTAVKGKYLIPASELDGLGTLNLGPKVEKWKVV